MNGTAADKFSPNGTATYAMVVTMLWRIAGEPVVDYAMDYADVDADMWYTEAARWAASEGIFKGVAEGEFGVKTPAVREKIVEIMYNFAVAEGHDVSVGEETNILSYEDAFELMNFTAMQWACGSGIINGNNGYLKPNDQARRSEVAAMFQRLCKVIDAEGIIPASDLKGWVMNTEFGEAAIPERAQAAFEKAMDGFVGVGYTPVAYLGSQVVAGANYAFLCKTTTVTAKPKTGLAYVVIYADLSGGASVRDIRSFDAATLRLAEVDFSASRLLGGFNRSEAVGASLPKAAQTAFDGAFAGLTGVGYAPLALLASKETDGATSYAVLCKATTVAANPASALAIAVIGSGSEEGAKLLSVSGFSFAEKNAPQSGAVLPPAVTAYESLEELNAVLGTKLAKPGVMGVTDEVFRTVKAGGVTVAEYEFSLNGLDCCYRAAATTDDISGVYINAEPAFGKYSGELEFNADETVKVARWFTLDGQYVFAVTDNGVMTDEQFAGIAEEIKLGTAVSNSTPVADVAAYYASLAGSYQDQYSGRATMTVTANGENGIIVEVSWANSAFETCVWKMSVKRLEDGLLGYDDCVKSIVSEDGVTVVSEDGEGFFSVGEDGIFRWTGAAEENCMNCEFVKAE